MSPVERHRKAETFRRVFGTEGRPLGEPNLFITPSGERLAWYSPDEVLSAFKWVSDQIPAKQKTMSTHKVFALLAQALIMPSATKKTLKRNKQ